MVPNNRYQRARSESHLFEPGEKPTHLLIGVGNFAGVRVSGVFTFVRLRRIVRSMRIEIVRPQEEPLLPVLLEPLDNALGDQSPTALGENTGQVILFGLVAHAVVIGRETVCKAELF